MKLFFYSVLLFSFFTPIFSYGEGDIGIKIYNADSFPDKGGVLKNFIYSKGNEYNGNNLFYEKGKWLNLGMVIPDNFKKEKDYFFIISEKPETKDTCGKTYFVKSDSTLKLIEKNSIFDGRFIEKGAFNSNNIFITSIRFNNLDLGKKFRLTVVITKTGDFLTVEGLTLDKLKEKALNILDKSFFSISVIEKKIIEKSKNSDNSIDISSELYDLDDWEKEEEKSGTGEDLPINSEKICKEFTFQKRILNEDRSGPVNNLCKGTIGTNILFKNNLWKWDCGDKKCSGNLNINLDVGSLYLNTVDYFNKAIFNLKNREITYSESVDFIEKIYLYEDSYSLTFKNILTESDNNFSNNSPEKNIKKIFNTYFFINVPKKMIDPWIEIYNSSNISSVITTIGQNNAEVVNNIGKCYIEKGMKKERICLVEILEKYKLDSVYKISENKSDNGYYDLLNKEDLETETGLTGTGVVIGTGSEIGTGTGISNKETTGTGKGLTENYTDCKEFIFKKIFNDEEGEKNLLCKEKRLRYVLFENNLWKWRCGTEKCSGVVALEKDLNVIRYFNKPVNVMYGSNIGYPVSSMYVEKIDLGVDSYNIILRNIILRNIDLGKESPKKNVKRIFNTYFFINAPSEMINPWVEVYYSSDFINVIDSIGEEGNDMINDIGKCIVEKGMEKERQCLIEIIKKYKLDSVYKISKNKGENGYYDLLNKKEIEPENTTGAVINGKNCKQFKFIIGTGHTIEDKTDILCKEGSLKYPYFENDLWHWRCGVEKCFGNIDIKLNNSKIDLNSIKYFNKIINNLHNRDIYYTEGSSFIENISSSLNHNGILEVVLKSNDNFSNGSVEKDVEKIFNTYFLINAPKDVIEYWSNIYYEKGIVEIISQHNAEIINYIGKCSIKKGLEKECITEGFKKYKLNFLDESGKKKDIEYKISENKSDNGYYDLLKIKN